MADLTSAHRLTHVSTYKIGGEKSKAGCLDGVCPCGDTGNSSGICIDGSMRILAPLEQLDLNHAEAAALWF